MRIKTLIMGLSFVAITSAGAYAKTPYSDILNKMIPPTIKYSVKVEKHSDLKGFKQLNVAIENRKMGVVIHRYLWISKDKKTIIPIVLSYKNGKIIRVEPKKQIERIAVNLTWFTNFIKSIPPKLLKSYGKGVNVYMFSDPLCPFCKRQLPELVKLAEEGKIKLHILPLNIHGELAKRASAVFLNIEEKEGLKAAIDKVEGASFAKVENIARNTKNIKKLLKKYSPLMDKIMKVATKHGINGTPTTIILLSKNRGYLVMGLSDVARIIKEK